MFGWFRNKRRRRLAASAFPEEWEAVLRENADFFWQLEPYQQRRIRAAILVFANEKNFEGCGGQVITHVHRVTIAAQMARLTLGFDQEWFDAVKSILVYPDAYRAQSKELLGATVIEGDSERLGEAWYRGPVILSWVDVLASSRGENFGRNVVVHEFAHQLDMQNGSHADGVPVIEDSRLAQLWLDTLHRDYQQLTALCQAGTPTTLDCYGATNHAEFFAVCSEAFFEQPQQLRFEWPEMYGLLGRFYRQTPPS